MKSALARGAVWITATRGAINVIGFFSALLLARLLLPEDFGLVAIATTMIAIMTSVTEISLSSALLQHKDPSEEHYHTAWTLGLLRALIVSMITAALAWPLAALYGDERLVGLILALSATSALGGIANPKVIELTRALVFRQEFILGVSNKLIAFLVSAVIAVVWHSYWALVAGQIVAQVSSVLISYALVRYRPRFALSKTRELLSFSVWLTFSQILTTLNYRFDTLFIGYFLGNAKLGIYSYGDNLANMVTREATSPIANTLFPAFSRMADDPDRLRAAYFKAQGLLFAIALPVGVGFAMIAEPLILLALGEKWRGAIFIVQVIASSTGAWSVGATYFPLALALGKTESVFNRDLCSFLLRVPILATGYLFGGLTGFVVARLATGGLGLVLNMTLIRSLIGLGLRAQFLAQWRPAFAALVMVGALLAYRLVNPLPINSEFAAVRDLGIEIGLAGTIYVFTLWLSWRVSGRPSGVEAEAFNLISRYLSVSRVG